MNTDAFSTDAKSHVTDLLEEHYGPVDYLIYSLAAPRRTDPATGEVHHSVIKPIGAAYEAPALDFSTSEPAISWTRIEPGTETDPRDGRGDGRRRLVDVGPRPGRPPALGAPVYRQGTIGAAKEYLKQTARDLNDSLLLNENEGSAFTVVAGAAVTQASSAIPSIALYTAFLRTVLGDNGFRTTAQQATDLWDQLEGRTPVALDNEGRIRLDGWELDDLVQDQVRALWADPQRSLNPPAPEPTGSWAGSGLCTAGTSTMLPATSRPRPTFPGSRRGRGHPMPGGRNPGLDRPSGPAPLNLPSSCPAGTPHQVVLELSDLRLQRAGTGRPGNSGCRRRRGNVWIRHRGRLHLRFGGLDAEGRGHATGKIRVLSG